MRVQLYLVTTITIMLIQQLLNFDNFDENNNPTPKKTSDKHTILPFASLEIPRRMQEKVLRKKRTTKPPYWQVGQYE